MLDYDSLLLKKIFVCQVVTAARSIFFQMLWPHISQRGLKAPSLTKLLGAIQSPVFLAELSLVA